MGSSPNFTYGQVPTPAQWNVAFSSKQDDLGYDPLNQAGGAMAGRLIMAPSSAAASGLNIAPGVAPSSPENGDLWTTGSGLFVQISGSTLGPLASGLSPGTNDYPLVGNGAPASTYRPLPLNGGGVTNTLPLGNGGTGIAATSLLDIWAAMVAVLPTTLPGTSGVAWNNGGVISIS